MSSESVGKVRNQKRHLILSYKEKVGCYVCGEKRGPCLDFHHSDPIQKNPSLKRKLPWKQQNWCNLGWDSLVTEIQKCDVICANCHRALDGSAYTPAEGYDAHMLTASSARAYHALGLPLPEGG